MEAKTMVIKNARVKWAKVFEPDGTYPPAKWSIDIFPSEEDAKILREEGMNLRDKGEGVYFQAKRKVKTAKGATAQAPRVVGPGKQDFTQPIGNGSVCDIIIKLFPYTNYGGGVTAYLEAVRVVNHVPYKEDETADFDGDGATSTSDDGLPF